MTLVRGQILYGTVFEVESLDFTSSIAYGGRYDNLIGKFLKEQIPAVDFIGFERIYSILMEKEAYKTEKQKKVVLIMKIRLLMLFVMQKISAKLIKPLYILNQNRKLVSSLIN